MGVLCLTCLFECCFFGSIRKMKSRSILVIIITLLTVLFGSWFTRGGLDWYSRLRLPAWTPSSTTISVVWTVIFTFATVSALIILQNKKELKWRRRVVLVLFALNVLLNMGWSLLFFTLHQIEWAMYDSAALGISVFLIMAVAWRISRPASVFLIPYALWVTFTTYLTYIVWILNR